MNENAFLAIFPFLFIGGWLIITALLWLFSGWKALQDRFPDHDELPLKRMHFQSATFGDGFFGSNYGGCLRFDVCRSGLRVAVWRIFGPLSQPFFVPWSEITTDTKRFLGLPHYVFGFYRFRLGKPEVKCLVLNKRAALRIAEASEGQLIMPPPDAS